MSLECIANIPATGRTHLLCLEVNPPRGVDMAPIFGRLDGQVEGIDFFNVTDSALAKMRFAPLPFAALLKQRYGIEPMVNISCRDRNLIALQGDLLAGWALGIRSIIALTGDAVTIGDSPERKGVFEVNSVGLLNAIQTLNQGRDLAGHELKGKPEYLPGVVVNPNAKNIGAEIKRLKRKKDAGAVYALSQPVFDPAAAVEFFREAQPVGVALFVGLLPFKSAEALGGIAKIPGIRIPEALIKEAASKGTDAGLFSIDHCLKLAQEVKQFVRGFHVISGATPKLGLDLAHALRPLTER